MKKSYLLSITAAALITLSQPSLAQDSGPYFQGTISGTDLANTELHIPFATNVDYDSDIGIGLGGEFGYKANKYLRGGLELTYRRNDVSAGAIGGKFESYAGMGNLYLDIPIGVPVTPYIGAGAGYARVGDGDVHDGVLAYQGMAGLSYAANDKTDIVLGYRYFGTKDPEYSVSGVNIKAPYRVHNVDLGVRFKF